MPNKNCSCSSGQGWDCKSPAGSFLMQRILASGALHARCRPYPLCFDTPCGVRPPLSILSVSESGPPRWEEKSCCERGCRTLCVTLPLCLTIRDPCGRHFQVSSEITEEVRLHLRCPEEEAWRGQLFVQGAARLCRAECPCGKEVPLEVRIEAYLLAPCAVGAPCPPPCPPQKPWYPQPRFDPFR